MTTAKVLCVDDDARILKGIRRQLGDQFALDCAEGPQAALEQLEQSGPYAVVVSDMRMPGMTGIELLTRIRSTSPDTVRIMLTGEADLATTIAAVNEGHIFRFLTKPCAPDVLGRAVSHGLRQYELVTAEKELVQGTLKGSVKVLSEMLSLVNPLAFGRAARVRRMATRVGEALSIDNLWELEIAAMLSQLGCVTVPTGIIEKVSRGEELSAQERSVYQQHSELACNLLRNIPRLETVADTIRYQSQHLDGTGFPGDGRSGQALPLGARILKAVLDLDTETALGADPIEAIHALKRHPGHYDPDVLTALEPLVVKDCGLDVISVNVADLSEGMLFAADVRSTTGQLLVAKGQEITASLRLKLIAMNGALREPLSVTFPQRTPTRVGEQLHTP
jgi:response regulator RpfG family c-di-GMP phosphodiesterase